MRSDELNEDRGDAFPVTLDVLLHKRLGLGLPLPEAFALFRQVLVALEHAHRHGVVHGEIKPADVTVLGDGHVKLRFGLAAPLGSASSPALALGAPAYKAPEQFGASAADPRSDVYSAALVLYETLAGHHPFRGKKDLALVQSHLDETPLDLKAVIPELPAGVSEVVAIALRKDPKQRFQRAEDFLGALREGVAGFLPVPPEDEPTLPESPPLLQPPRLGRSTLVLAACLLLAALGLVGVGGSWHVRNGLEAPRPAREQKDPVAVRVAVDRGPAPPARSPTTPDPIVSISAAPMKPPPAPPTAAPPPPAVELGPQQGHRQLVEQAREEVRQGVARAEAAIEVGDFDTAQEQLDLTASLAQGYVADLQEEVARIREVRQRLTVAVSRKWENQLQVADWERRLRLIEALLEQAKYPEADSLALSLSGEPGIPEPLAAKARELSARARSELKKIWGDAEMGPTKNEIRQRRDPPNP